MCCRMKQRKFIFVAVAIMLLFLSGCSLGNKVDSSPPTTLDKEQITEDFRRLRTGCARSSIFEFSSGDEMLYRSLFSTGYQEAPAVFINRFCEFKGVELITNYFPQETFEKAYRRFRENRPDKEVLIAEINRILSNLESDPSGSAGIRFDTVFAIPQLAVLAAMQPQLTEVSPTIRHDIGWITVDRWFTRIALNPEFYQSRRGIVDIFDEFRENGWTY